MSWIWELSASVAIGFAAPAPASLILGICVRSHRQCRQVALPRLRRKGGCGGRPGPSGAISIGSAPGSPDPPPRPGLALLASRPPSSPARELDHPPPPPRPRPAQSVFPKLGTRSRRNGEGREAKVAAPPYPKWRRPDQQGREEGWTPSASGLRVVHRAPPEQVLARQAAPWKWEIAREAQPRPPPSGDLHTPPAPPPPGRSSFARLRSRNHQPNLPPFTSDTLSGDSNADAGAREGPGVRRGQSFASCGAPYNGPPNRLRQWQPLRELRSRATGWGGWERVSEEEGAERARRKPASGSRETGAAWTRPRRSALARQQAAPRKGEEPP